MDMLAADTPPLVSVARHAEHVICSVVLNAATDITK
jgi:hypothetical protein